LPKFFAEFHEHFPSFCEYFYNCPRTARWPYSWCLSEVSEMSDYLSSFLGGNSSGPVAVLREIVQMLVKALGPLVDVLKPLWDRLVAFLSKCYEQLREQQEQDEDRANWGRPELGWTA
jgi:hypothetical protein